MFTPLLNNRWGVKSTIENGDEIFDYGIVLYAFVVRL